MQQRVMWRRWIWLPVGAAVLLAAAAGAGPGRESPESAGAQPASGVRAFVDPETGRLTANPTRAQLQRLAVQSRAASLSRSTAGLRPFELSRGGRGVNLQGRFQTALRVEVGEDGGFHMTCGDPAHDGKAHSRAHRHTAAEGSSIPDRPADAPER